MELTKRWRWLGVEFLVIALGVLSALFVDTWIEDRENARREEVYRQRLAADLQRDVINLGAVIDYFTRVREYGLTTLADLEGVQRLDDFALLFAAFNAAEEWGFQLESSTFNDLQNTGGLSLIQDVQFRIDLAEYHRQGRTRGEQWNLSREYRAVARGIIPNTLQTAIHATCVSHIDAREPFLPAAAVDAAGGAYSAAVEPFTGSASAEGTCGLDPASYEVARGAAELRADAQVARLLRFRISELRVAMALFEGQRRMAEQLIQRL